MQKIDKLVLKALVEDLESMHSLVDAVEQCYREYTILVNERNTIAYKNSIAGLKTSKHKMAADVKDQIVSKGRFEIANLETEIVQKWDEIESKIELVEAYLESNPPVAVSLLIPEDLANAIKFACSDIVDYVNGTVNKTEEGYSQLLNQPSGYTIVNDNGIYTIIAEFLMLPETAKSKISYEVLTAQQDSLSETIETLLLENGSTLHINKRATRINKLTGKVQISIRLMA